MQDALHEVTISGTAAGVFAGFPIPAAGKTGTAQVFGKNPNGSAKSDTSWFAGYAPSNNPEYVAVMMVSQGGFGAGTSGIGVRKIFETIFGVQGGKVNPELQVFPDGNPPTKLPRISPATKPKPSILAPGTTAQVQIATSPTPKAKR